MTEITPLAVSHKDVLRWCAANTPQPPAAIAAGTERVPSNVRRDLPKLVEAGLLAETNGLFGLTLGGLATVEALDLAEGRTNAVRPRSGSDGEADAVAQGNDAPEGFGWFTHADIRPDPNNARKDFDEEELRGLADSMADKGLLQKPAVRRIADEARSSSDAEGDAVAQPRVQLVAGERRWRAWGALIELGVWPADHRELLPIIEGDDAHVEEAGLIENLQRQDLKPLEEARGFKRLIEVHGYTTATIADKVRFTQRFVQQRLQLLDLKPDDARALDEGRINIEQARQRIAAYPKPFELTPEQRLIFLEIAHRHATLGLDIGWHNTALVGASIADDAAFTALNPLSLFSSGQDEDTAARTIALNGYYAPRALLQYTGVDSPEVDAIAGPLFDLRAALGVRPAEGHAYVTPWLNPPYEPTPEDLAAHKARLAEIEENIQRREDDANAARVEREAENEAAAAFLSAVRRFEESLAADASGFGARLTALLADHGRPAPWSIRYARESDYSRNLAALIHDADGAPNVGLPDAIEAIRRIHVLALAHACGLPLVSGPWEPEPYEGELDRDGFELAMADRLRESYTDESPADALARAQRLLAEHLSENGVAFGDDSWVWDRDAAGALADELDAEDMSDVLAEGDERADDRASEAAPDAEDPSDADPELSDSLKRLAGVPAEADA